MCFDEKRVYYTKHAVREMESEELGEIIKSEVEEAVSNCEILEEYVYDKPFRSCLLFGETSRQRPLHFVCAHDVESNLAIVVTVYEPDPARWFRHKERKTQ